MVRKNICYHIGSPANALAINKADNQVMMQFSSIIIDKHMILLSVSNFRNGFLMIESNPWSLVQFAGCRSREEW